jgi:hypothetical protein
VIEKEQYPTSPRVPKNAPEITIQTDGALPNPDVISGDSVNEHKYLEVANARIVGEEMKQKNESWEKKKRPLIK